MHKSPLKFFFGSGLSTENYSNILIGWESKDVQDDLTLNVGGIKYNAGAAAARQSLIDDHNWTITDGGQA